MAKVEAQPIRAAPRPPALGPELAALAVEMASGDRPLYSVPRELNAWEAAAVRRRSLELRAAAAGTDLELNHLGAFTLDAERAATQHCENFAGAAQVPLGLVGPLRLSGVGSEGQDDELGADLSAGVIVPLATTEGALLASVNRGCRAITASGGARVWVEDVGMTRAPVFRTRDLAETRRLLGFLEQCHDEIRERAEATSRFLQLVEVRPMVLAGTTVLVRFRFHTGDAMGMNMVTIACDRIVRELIEPGTGVRCVALSSNYCTDKKSSAVNFQLGRGKRVIAECVLDAATLERTLKTRAELLVEVQLRKNLHGSIAAGSMGYNAQFANVLAALFVATGQDLAHVVEGAMGLTHFEPRADGGVYSSVTLPDLPVAAIGGGTGLATQREALAILGIVPDPQRPGLAARRLAAIAGAVVLAGELSLMAAFTSNDLARAHERLGRGAGDVS